MKKMNNNVKDAEQFPAATASKMSNTSTNNDNITITQTKSKCQGTHKKARERKVLSAHAKVYSVAIKCYVEQMPNGWNVTQNLIRQVDSSKYIVIGICHNRDEVTDGIWNVAKEKEHYHIIVKCRDRNKTVKVTTVLNMLGIKFRKDIDDNIWINHGVESVGNFASYAVYLTHETEAAIKEHKERYALSEYVSNITISEINQIRDGYFGYGQDVQKITDTQMNELDKVAYELGYSLADFDEWYNKLSFFVRSNVKMRTIRESYGRGVTARIAERREITRLCVFIQGSPGIGKTYAAQTALLNKRTLSVNGGGTGKFDNLKPTHEAIIIDDETCPNLLNMTDNYICPVYRRNKNNPVWAGGYFVVTSNLDFRGWAESCGIHTRNTKNYYGADVSRCPDSETYKALLSRFYICHVETNVNGRNVLILDVPSCRGSVDEQQLRLNMFKEFRVRFNAIIASYVSSTNTVDYNSVLAEDKAIMQAKADKKRQEELQLQQQQLQQQKIIAQLMTQQKIEEPKQMEVPEPPKPPELPESPEPKQGGLWYVPFDADKNANVIHAGRLRYDAI